MRLPLELLVTAAVALAPAGAALQAGAADDTLTPWHVATMTSVRSAEISPDGRHVAYVLAVPREPWGDDDGPARSQLHVLDWESGAARPFVTADSGVSSVQWTPDGKSIGFLAKRDGDEHTALYLIAVDGGEARRAVSFDDRDVGDYQFAPDGTRVALIAQAPAPEAREKQEKKGFKQEIYEEDWRPGEVWIAVPFDEDAEPRAIALDAHVSDLEWAPDGAHLALAAAPTALVDDSYMRRRVWIVDVASASVAGRIENPGKLGSFAWKPDGSGLALVAARHVHDGAAARLLWASAPAGDAGVEPTPMLGERERDEDDVRWLADGRLLVLGSEGAWSALDAYSFDGGRAVGRTPLVPREGPVWTSVSASRDGSRMALVGSTPEHPPELFTLEVASGELARRSDSNPWLGALRLARQEVVRFAARDGLEVEGVLIHPRDGAAPAPLLVCVHGGPEAHLSNGWLTRYAYPGQLAAARGYAVFHPNYRGSTGRGLAYLERSQGDPAGKEFDDVVDGVDHLVAAGIADRARVGVTGGSYGGYATAWCSTYYSERFAAGVMFVGISDKISKVGTTDIADEEFYVHALKRPWDDWDFFLKRSPIYHADRGKTPLLILHGKDDPRVDPGQSRELYRHLKLRGAAPVRLVHYPGEGHGNRKAAAQFDYNLRMLRWFDHYVVGPGGDPPAFEVDYEEHVEKKDEDEESEATGS